MHENILLYPDTFLVPKKDPPTAKLDTRSINAKEVQGARNRDDLGQRLSSLFYTFWQLQMCWSDLCDFAQQKLQNTICDVQGRGAWTQPHASSGSRCQRSSALSKWSFDDEAHCPSHRWCVIHIGN